MLDEVRLADALWARADERRRGEYRACAEDLRRADGFDARVARLHLELDATTLRLSGRSKGEQAIAEVDVARADLAALTEEYLEVIAQVEEVGRTGGISRMEALDMAKKVVHDRAGRLLVRRCRPLGLDLESARRLFSLWVALTR